jgi:hypothetical protein
LTYQCFLFSVYYKGIISKERGCLFILNFYALSEYWVNNPNPH